MDWIHQLCPQPISRRRGDCIGAERRFQRAHNRHFSARVALGPCSPLRRSGNVHRLRIENTGAWTIKLRGSEQSSAEHAARPLQHASVWQHNFRLAFSCACRRMPGDRRILVRDTRALQATRGHFGVGQRSGFACIHRVLCQRARVFSAMAVHSGHDVVRDRIAQKSIAANRLARIGPGHSRGYV